MSRRGFDRRPSYRLLRPKIIIACEGAATERGYFLDLNRVHRLTSVEVRVLPHEGTDPRTVVRSTADYVRQARKEQTWDAERDQAWAVFDGEEHLQTEGQRGNWNAAMQMARDLKIHLAVSNPCFEFWYLLHFQDHRAYLNRVQALRLLKGHLPRYEKAHRLYEVLQHQTDMAIQRALELQELASKNEVHLHENPCCGGVASLVKLLRSLN